MSRIMYPYAVGKTNVLFFSQARLAVTVDCVRRSRRRSSTAHTNCFEWISANTARNTVTTFELLHLVFFTPSIFTYKGSFATEGGLIHSFYSFQYDAPVEVSAPLRCPQPRCNHHVSVVPVVSLIPGTSVWISEYVCYPVPHKQQMLVRLNQPVPTAMLVQKRRETKHSPVTMSTAYISMPTGVMCEN